ncbi:Ig-like domain-containing protein [Pseudoalteromonas rubra]|uniref:Ig-like domain-containing protein n=1 Tax=Pseudoalteromonas rubra TaxID=43658 RepID=A0A0U3I807_9GAMM|nr:Ig-like domain-containing protein [Pseudoalteromonas rubra]ALU46118.1 hypothetical protein AT705_24460 [Pseudoalteromonas rubra]
MKIKHVFALVAAMAVCGAHAEIIQYQFNHAQSGAVTAISPNAPIEYLSAKGNIRFVLSSGLDRKIRLRLLNAQGTQIAQQESSLITPSDRLTVDGRSYYGKELYVQAPGEGEYQVVQEVLSTNGDIVQTFRRQIAIDTTAPVANTTLWVSGDRGYNQVYTGDLWKLGMGGSGQGIINMSELTDDTMIDNVTMELYRQNGQLYHIRPASYDLQTQKAVRRYDAGLFPSSNLDEVFTLKMIARDVAGNFITATQKAMFDNVNNISGRPFAVYDPDVTAELVPGAAGFVPYEHGMTIKTNPIKLLYRIPRLDWHEYRLGGVHVVNGIGESKVLHVNSEYVYLYLSTPHNARGTNDVRFVNFGTWGSMGLDYDLKLSDYAPKSPLPEKIEYNYSDIGWSSWHRYYIHNSKLPVSISGVRITAQSRPYPQTFSHSGVSCVIPAGQTSCSASWQRTMAKGTRGYLHDAMSLRNESGTLMASRAWAEVNWNDSEYPQVTPEHDPLTNTLTAYIFQAARGAYFDRLRLRGAWLEDRHGNRLQVDGGRSAESGGNYTYTWDLDTLPEGTFEVYVVAEEMHGPTTRESALTITSDRTAPTLSVSVRGDGQVTSLDDIVITASDAVSAIHFESVRLQGGPAREDIYLSTRQLSSNTYALAYPVMFPSMSVGEGYTLTVTAADEQGNARTETLSFDYQPRQVAMLNDDAQLRLPNINRTILRLNGLNPIYSDVVKLGDGSKVHGTYPIYVTVRSDAQGSVVVEGTEVAPGQTVTITNAYNFDAHDNRYDLSLHPADPTIRTQGSLLIGSTAPNAPILVTGYDFVELAQETSYNAEPLAVVERLALNMKLTGTSNFCRTLTTDPAVAANSDPYANPSCLVRFDSPLVKTALSHNGDQVTLNGYVSSLKTQSVRARVYTYGYRGELIQLADELYAITPRSPNGTLPTTLLNAKATLLHEIEALDVKAAFEAFKGCQLTDIREQAIEFAFDNTPDDILPRCLVEWQSFPDGIVALPGTESLGGYAQTLGDSEIRWTISIFHNGSDPITLAQGQHALSVIAPTAPHLQSTQLRLSNGTMTQGESHFVRDSRAETSALLFSVAVRDYPQRIVIGDLGCVVPAGQSECQVPLKVGPLGDKQTEIQGRMALPIDIDATRPYFAPRDQGHFEHDIVWDYTPPKIDSVHINNAQDGRELVATVAHEQLTLTQDQVAVVVYSPFAQTLTDNTWRLLDPTLTFLVDDAIEFEQAVKIDDNVFFFDHEKRDLDVNNTTAPLSIRVIGNYLVYLYSFHSLPDGAFRFAMNVRDHYTNGADYEHETFLMQRTVPQIQLSFLRDRLRKNVDGIYFLDDFGAVTNPGWDTQNEIYEATFGGIALTLTDDLNEPRENVKFFAGDVSALTPGQSYPLIVKARDTAGNIMVLSEDMTYAPSSFNIKTSTGSNVLYEKSQRGTAYISQRLYQCNFAGSRELAVSLSRPARKGCYVAIDHMPDGMDSVFQGWAVTVTGSVLSKEDNEITYSVYVVDQDGDEVRVKTDSLAWDVKPTEAMTLTLNPMVKLADNVIGVTPEAPVLSRYTIEDVSGEVNMSIFRGELHSEEFISQRSHKPIYDLFGVIRDDDVTSRTVFDRYQLKVGATYNLAPDIGVHDTRDVIVLPSRRTALNLSMDNGTELLSTDSSTVTAHMGLWSWKDKQSQYDPRTMGEWDIYIAYKSNTNDEVILTDTKMSDGDGRAQFTVEMADLFRKSSSFYAVAKVRSPHAEYSHTLKSTPLFVRLLLGTGVEGKLSSNMVSGKAPFTTLIRYEYDSLEDMVAGNDMRWEVSEDQQSWRELTQFSGRSAIPYLMSEVGDKYIRAIVTNKNTQESSTSDTLRISAYNKANLSIKGPAQVYAGQNVMLSMYNYVDVLNAHDGVAMWSEDGGANWYEGSTQQRFVATEETKLIMGKFKYASTTDGAGKAAWSQARYYLRPVAPRPVMAQIRAPHLIEIGEPITVTGQVMNANGGVDLPIRYEWHLPDGSVRTDASFEYTPGSDYLDERNRLKLKLLAWVDGYRNATQSEALRFLETWTYRFPETSISVRSTVLVAPATVTGMIQQQRSFMPGIQYHYQWHETPQIEVARPNSIASQIVIKTPGVHELRATIVDSRGKAKEVSQFVDVLEPSPITGEMMTYASNRYQRAPLGIVARAKTSGGHPQDFMVDYQWYLNGEKVTVLQPRSPMHRFEIETAGDYEIRVEATSQFGQQVAFTEQVTIHPNKVPQCESVTDKMKLAMRVTARCTDEDGFITAYDWWFNGEYIGRGAPSTQLSLETYPNALVEYEAIDDAGGRTRGRFSW